MSSSAIHPQVFLTHNDFSDILESSRARVHAADLYPLKASRLRHVHKCSDTEHYRISKPYKSSHIPPSISRIAQSQIQHTLKHTWASSTMEKYAYGIQHFIAFCDKENIESCFRLPASKFLLCTFVSSRAGKLAGTTVRNEISAVRAWHILNDSHYHGGLHLNYIFKGVKNLCPESSKRPPRPPITTQMLLFLHADLNLNNPLDAGIQFTASSAFWGQIRLRKILSPIQDNWDPELILSQYHMCPPHTATSSRIQHLPNTKVAGRKRENIFLCRQHGPTDPSHTFLKHM